ncbi:response regulator transcription factor [Poseidonibacter lekithochrous]|uniref:response regulator transcription factor n=1 Tax=Poseidonibacter TaxID=2321187 RepID=UPI001C098FED|nr:MULTISPECIES: response regulator transcription factor [Poseidonibacter]MBU3015586.1 response regulator transcription factor [Poseidonibacter lekithochrous]MDO6828885.1 response regulator transcription factor [Poseidonibacter sp. 1_MG-2023]
MDQNNLHLNNILKNLNILYIEDEENIRINIAKTLKILAKNVYDVETIEDANYFIDNKRIDIIISDINLGEDNGLDFIEKLRTYNKSIPVILLSAYTDTDYLLKATKLKLVDYLRKPIDFKMLKKALINSVQDILDNSKYIVNFSENIIYNVLHKKLYNTQENNEISLTSKELILLDYLIKFNNRVVSHDELKLNIWQDSFDATDSALKNLLNKLRKKIGKDSIINISGVGFRVQIQ